MSRTEITIPPERGMLDPVIRFVLNYAKKIKLGPLKQEYLKNTCSTVLELAILRSENLRLKGKIKVLLEKSDNRLLIEILNKGCPLFPDEFFPLPEKPSIFELQSKMDFCSLDFHNNGREGQSVKISVQLDGPGDAGSMQKNEPVATGEITLRRAAGEDASRISSLFYQVYEYRYINEYVYFPDKLRSMIEQEKLVSVIAESASGELMGHVGLVKRNDSPPVYEAGLGIVDPVCGSSGLFGRLFGSIIEIIKTTPMQYCVYDFVTNHDYSQRRVARFGYCDMALFIGNQVADTQARLELIGIGADPKDMDRYSLLLAIEPHVPRPFGKTVVLPVNLGEACGFLLKPLNINWLPEPRFYPLPPAGDFRLDVQKEQKTAIFDFHQPGKQALDRVIEKWRQLLPENIQYFAIDVPVDFSGLGQLYDALSKHGFFMAGFLPYNYSDRLGFRFQFLAPSKVNFDGIKLFSENGRRLLRIVRDNYQRNRVI